MNIATQLNNLMPKQEKAFATIIGQKGAGKVVAQTPSGARIYLNGTLETGKKCFYDRRTSTILSKAPNLTYREFGV